VLRLSKLTDDEIDKKVEEYKKTLTPRQKEAFDDITGTTGTRAYVKKSNTNLKKAFNKIKKNVQKAYPNEGDKSGFEKPNSNKEDSGFVKPKPKSTKKKTTDKTKKKAQPKKQKKNPVHKNVKKGKINNQPSLGKLQNQPQEPRRLKEKRKVTELKGKYSQYEIHEGINSKRAIAYRKKNGVNDRGKENGF
jgi:hypothetical protein